MIGQTCAAAVFSLLYCGAACGAAAGEAPLSATRYIDAQGVEMIQNRARPAPAAAVVQAPAALAAKPSAAARAPGWQISAAEQAGRDQDRLDILKQELAAEVRLYESVTKALAGVAGKTTDASGQARLYRDLNEHQKNIQSLHAEIRRIPAAR
ncbi:hypothetical protein CSQ96_08455 [Janthinobacterium sp. BJB412]|nr:hypothetical protein CSQ96_08455 [Janthinobacterium sp. BJB412]